PEAQVMPVKAPCIEAVEEAAAHAKAAEEARVAAAATLASRGVKQARNDESRRHHPHTTRRALARAEGKPDAATRKVASHRPAGRASEKRATRASHRESRTAKNQAPQKRTHVADAR